jgi:hypothetical protein
VRNDECQNCRAQGEIHKVTSQPIRRFLDRSPRFLRAFDGFNDPSERRVAPEFLGADFQCA